MRPIFTAPNLPFHESFLARLDVPPTVIARANQTIE
jgi:hypothetical protein